MVGAEDVGIDLRAVGAVAEVKATLSPASRPAIQQTYGIAELEDVEALVYSFAGFSADAVAWADLAGVALFDIDSNGEARPASLAAHALTEGRKPLDGSDDAWLLGGITAVSRQERPARLMGTFNERHEVRFVVRFGHFICNLCKAEIQDINEKRCACGQARECERPWELAVYAPPALMKELASETKACGLRKTLKGMTWWLAERFQSEAQVRHCVAAVLTSLGLEASAFTYLTKGPWPEPPGVTASASS